MNLEKFDQFVFGLLQLGLPTFGATSLLVGSFRLIKYLFGSGTNGSITSVPIDYLFLFLWGVLLLMLSIWYIISPRWFHAGLWLVILFGLGNYVIYNWPPDPLHLALTMVIPFAVGIYVSKRSRFMLNSR